MDEITKEAVEAKLEKGEDLTPEETEFVMSAPNEEALAAAGATTEAKEDEVDEEEYEDIDEKEKKEEDIKKKDEDTSDSKEKDEKKETPEPDKKGETEDPDKDKEPEEEEEKDKSEEDFDLNKEVDDSIDRPDHEVEDKVKDLTSKEKGFFYSMLASKRRMKRAEEDLDVEKFDRAKEKKEREESKGDEGKTADDELNDLLEGDDDDFISKADLKKVIGKLKTAPAKDEGISEEEALEMASKRERYLVDKQIDAMAKIDDRRDAGETLPNFKKVMDLGEDIIASNPEYVKQVRESVANKENPALVAYNLIIKDAKFEHLYKGPKAPAKKTEDEGKKNLKKIDENLKKPKTTGSEGGGGETLKDSQGNEYTLNALQKMSNFEFRKVPKEIREKLLKSMA